MTDETHLVVIRGDATAEEVAALLTALACVPQAPAAPTRHAPSEWPASTRLRTPVHARPGGWRASTLPR